MKPRPAIFRQAAKLVFASRTDRSAGSPFCCDNINNLTPDSPWEQSPEYELFAELFKPEASDSFAWWPDLDGTTGVNDSYRAWDYESRIYALLLAAEVARE